VTDVVAAGNVGLWKLVFRTNVPAPQLVLYLTPDKNHLVPGIMDLTVDPAITQEKLRKELNAKLASGAQLVSTDSSAITTMVVFSDFQCPYCKTFAEIMHQLTPQERSQVKLIYRQLPLNIHAWATDAAQRTSCVALQDRPSFLEITRLLVRPPTRANQRELRL